MLHISFWFLANICVFLGHTLLAIIAIIFIIAISYSVCVDVLVHLDLYCKTATPYLKHTDVIILWLSQGTWPLESRIREAFFAVNKWCYNVPQWETKIYFYSLNVIEGHGTSLNISCTPIVNSAGSVVSIYNNFVYNRFSSLCTSVIFCSSSHLHHFFWQFVMHTCNSYFSDDIAIGNLVRENHSTHTISATINWKQYSCYMIYIYISTYPYHLSIPVLLFMGSLPMQTIVNKWQCFHLFFKACTKGYVYSQLMSV